MFMFMQQWGRCVVVLGFFVYTIYLSFCAAGIKLCTPRCPAVLAWLRLQVQRKCA